MSFGICLRRANDAKGPEAGMLIYKSASEYWRFMTDSYNDMPIEGKNRIGEQEWHSELTIATGEVLKEFLAVVPPPFS